MSHRRATSCVAATLGLAALAMTACGAHQSVPSAGHPVTNVPATIAPTNAQTAASSTGAAIASAGQTPVALDGPGLQDAINTFGSRERVQQAADTMNQVLLDALAGCSRWTTPGADPMTGLSDLLTPEAYADVKANPGSLLVVTLPAHLSDGSTPAADAQRGCKVGTEHQPTGGFAVSVDHATNPQQPRLVLEGPAAFDLTLGGKAYVMSALPGTSQGKPVDGERVGLIPSASGWQVIASNTGTIDLSAAKG